MDPSEAEDGFDPEVVEDLVSCRGDPDVFGIGLVQRVCAVGEVYGRVDGDVVVGVADLGACGGGLRPSDSVGEGCGCSIGPLFSLDTFC